MRQRSGRGSWGVAALAVVALVAGGCSSGSDDEPTAGAPSSSGTPAPATVTTAVSFGQLAGKLPRPRRQQLTADVRQVVDGWVDAAYVGGDYPRTDFAGSWPGFTARARAKAQRDGDLMSNRDIGGSIDGVEVEKRAVRLDVLSVGQKPVGVTARVVLRFATTGETAQDVRVTGRLYLTKGKQGWQVFGYDVSKAAR